jgi:hypothetical protein
VVLSKGVDQEGTHLSGDLSLVVLHEIHGDGESLFFRHHAVGYGFCLDIALDV